MSTRRLTLSLLLLLFLAPPFAFPGGPLLVGGSAVGNRPAFGIDGQPFIWNPAKMPIQYRVDPGPMAITSFGGVIIDNATGLQRLQAMFGTWAGVSTTSISYANAGALLPAGTYQGGDLKTVQQYNDIIGSCRAGTQSPVIFDANGSIISSLGLPPEVIGFSSGCALDTVNGFLLTAAIVLNGKFQDGVNTPNTSPPNYELTANQFDEAITHEIGHFSGLDHSQINLDLLLGNAFPCDLDELAGLPLMFPVEMCQARKDAGLPTLAPDDMAWISALYPNANFVSNYATISGTILFSDGVSQLQGANVIARMLDDPTTPADESRRVAVSAISGYLFTGNPGQAVTASIPSPGEDNTNGSPSGSRNPQLIGYYQIFVPPGTYTVEVESIYSEFISDSGMGPLSPPLPLPGPAEFWNQDESAFDFPLQRDTLTVHAGDKITGIDIIINNTPPRFDQNEDSGALWDVPVSSPLWFAKDVRA